MQPFDHYRSGHSLAILALGALVAGNVLAKDGSQGLRFDSPGVLDLSAWPGAEPSDRSIDVGQLPSGEAEKILAKPELGEDKPGLPFSADRYGCAAESRSCASAGERRHIETAGKSVQRSGNRLVVTPEQGAAAVFVDWRLPATKTADGDAETHYYLGRLHDGGYHRVEVQFDQDSPGSFLINPANGKVAFVHNGGDIVALSPDGQCIVDLSQFEVTHPLRVAALDAAGPRQELQCALAKEKAAIQFKGWHDAASIDLVVKSGAEKDAVAIPLRLTPTAGAWVIAVRDPKPLAAIGFACRLAVPAAAPAN